MQQSFRDGMLSNGTMTSLNGRQYPLATRTDNPLHHQLQSLEPNHSTFEQQSSLTEQAATRGHITHDFLAKQVHCLNQKYASLKFTEFAEKLWLK